MRPALELAGVRKRFGTVEALRGVDFTLERGELHALLGGNGAGKSTLMHAVMGLVRPDGGAMRVDGVPLAPRSPRAARAAGIGMVHQHFTSIPALSVAENVALAAGWPVAPGPLRARTLALVARIGLPLDPDARAGELTVELKQRLEIVKALAADERILLLDEPTAVLAPREAAELLHRVRGLTRAGGSAVLITHKLDEALGFADRVTVLRRGQVTLTGAVAGLTAATLAAAMIGTNEAEAGSLRGGPPRHDTAGEVLIRAQGLDLPREHRLGLAIRHAAFAVRGGELVGLAAVEGNGQRELLRAIAGLHHPLRGRLDVTGPVAFVPEDRATEGLVAELTLTENVVLGRGASAPWVRRGLVDWTAARRRTAELIASFDIRAAGPDAPAASLSGGNQQKLIVARELDRAPRVLVADNPTRGLDLHATAAVHGRLRSAAAAGTAVVVHSSDLDEVLAIADRVLVVVAGTVLEAPPGASRSAIGELMLRGRELDAK